jgi:hypothetical protein
LKPRVAVFSFTSCEGCSLTILECENELLDILNLVAFVQALKKIGYQDGISPEVLGRIPKDMPPEEGAKLGRGGCIGVA